MYDLLEHAGNERAFVRDCGREGRRVPFYESLCNAMTHARMHACASGVLCACRLKRYAGGSDIFVGAKSS